MKSISSVPYSRFLRSMPSLGVTVWYQPIPVALIFRLNEVFQPDATGPIGNLSQAQRVALVSAATLRLALVAIAADETTQTVSGDAPATLAPESPRVTIAMTDAEVRDAALAAWRELCDSGILSDHEVQMVSQAAIDASTEALRSAKNG